MTDHKFTDDELQRCIECCIKGKVWGDCKKLNCPAIRKQGCHFYLRTDDDYENTIYIEILKDTLDLINRQKAEIDLYKRLNDELEDELASTYDKLENARAEAIKEFAERLVAIYENDKTYDRPNAHTLVVTVFRNIDTLVKEMTEESKR
jgi:hypothetical protein